LFRCFWPGLLMSPIDNPSAPPFLSFFMTPLIKATPRGKAKGKKHKVIAFFSMLEYNSWRAKLLEKGESEQYDIKYYKGLGTSTSAEAREYFKSFSSHYRPFRWASDVDGERLDMLFDKNRAMDRRNWMLNSIEANSAQLPYYSETADKISYEEFIDTEMINFANAGK
jgi:DNA topoisomerase-2